MAIFVLKFELGMDGTHLGTRQTRTNRIKLDVGDWTRFSEEFVCDGVFLCGYLLWLREGVSGGFGSDLPRF